MTSMIKSTDPMAKMIEFSHAAEAACGFMPTVPDVAVAVHEAGHAVVGRVLGLPCGEASIESDPQTIAGHAKVGHAWLLSRDRTHACELVEANIIVSMSGVVAERVLLGRLRDVGHDGDREDITRLAKTLRWPGGWKAARQRLQRRTCELVEEHRGAIRRVALALLKCRRLDGSAINGVLLAKD